jgi:hypothetical protein
MNTLLMKKTDSLNLMRRIIKQKLDSFQNHTLLAFQLDLSLFFDLVMINKIPQLSKYGIIQKALLLNVLMLPFYGYFNDSINKEYVPLK